MFPEATLTHSLFLNSCMNPIVYGFMSKNFRKGFKRALCIVAGNKDRHMSLNHSITIHSQTRR